MSTTRVSADLAAILDMAARLEHRAVDRAGANGMPGGEAMVNLAYVADLTVWERRNELADDALLTYEDPDEMWPAFQQLRFWSEQWREQLGMNHDDPRWRPTLSSEAAFLRNTDVLTWAWDHELHWDNFATDVAAAKAKLENVLVEGERPDRLRVACPDCTKAIAETTQDPDTETADRSAPRLIAVYGATRDDDHWKCPTCRHRFNADAVRRAGAAQMRTAGATERWITIADAISIIRRHGGWREATIRAWANDETQVSNRIRSNGVRMVWWPDMWRCHLLHRWEVNESRRIADERARRRAECERDHGPDCWVYRRGCSRIHAEAGAM